jgi:hypothetical protein
LALSRLLGGGRCDFGELPVKLLRALQTHGDVAGAINDKQVGCAGHVIELGNGTLIGFAVADLGPDDVFIRDESIHLGRFVIERDADYREPALLIFLVELLE